MRRKRVVRVVNGNQIGNRAAARPDIVDRCSPAPRGGEEVGRRDPPAVENDLAGGRLYGRGGRSPLTGDPAVDLAAHVRIEVEVGPGLAHCERIASRRNRLDLESFWQPVERHLAGNDAEEIRLEADVVDDAHLAVRRGGDELAAVGPFELERRRAGKEGQRACQLLQLLAADDPEAEAGPELMRARRELVRLAEGIAHAERRVGADGDSRLTRDEQHAHTRDRRRAERRALVVVGKDLVERHSLPRKAVGAPLREPDAVSPTAAADEERSGARLRGSCLRLRAQRKGRQARQ